MALRLPWLTTRDTPALRHIAALADALGAAVQTLAQVPGAVGEDRDRLERDLTEHDGAATTALMALLTALRSSYVTPLPREDLYLVASGLHAAVQRTVGAGMLVHRAGIDEMPAPALDILETLGRQAELMRRAAGQMRDLDALEDTWMQLLRGARLADRIMVDWLSHLGQDLLQRDFNRQREVAWSLQSTLEALGTVNSHLGVVLVRES